MDDEAVIQMPPDWSGADLQLQTLQGAENSGERIWDPGPPVPVPADNPEVETKNCWIYSAGLRVPPQYDNAPKPQTTKRGSWPRRWGPQHHPWSLEERPRATPACSWTISSRQRDRGSQEPKRLSQGLLLVTSGIGAMANGQNLNSICVILCYSVYYY